MRWEFHNQMTGDCEDCNLENTKTTSGLKMFLQLPDLTKESCLRLFTVLQSNSSCTHLKHICFLCWGIFKVSLVYASSFSHPAPSWRCAVRSGLVFSSRGLRCYARRLSPEGRWHCEEQKQWRLQVSVSVFPLQSSCHFVLGWLGTGVDG